MKTTFLTLLFLFAFSTLATGQIGRIQEATVEYDDTRVDALMVTLQPDRKDLQEGFEDWIDDVYDVKMKRGGLFANKKTQKAEDVMLPSISSEKITLMTKTEETGGETRFYLFAMRGNNPIDRADYKAFTGMENIFDSFLSSYLPDYYEERVTEARDELEDLQEDLADAEKEQRENEAKIKKLEEENRELMEKQQQLKKQIVDAELAVRDRENMRTEVRRELRDVSREPRRNRRNY